MVCDHECLGPHEKFNTRAHTAVEFQLNSAQRLRSHLSRSRWNHFDLRILRKGQVCNNVATDVRCASLVRLPCTLSQRSSQGTCGSFCNTPDGLQVCASS